MQNIQCKGSFGDSKIGSAITGNGHGRTKWVPNLRQHLPGKTELLVPETGTQDKNTTEMA